MRPKEAYARKPFLIVHKEKQIRKDIYGSIDDTIILQAQHLRGETDSDTVLVAMHPVGAPGYLPVFSALARAGHHVIACGSRYWNGDAALQMENVLLDLGACVREARERFGYRKVVLVGWSGGGAIMAGYQAEAEKRQIMQTSAGEHTPLAEARLGKGDALMLIASHRSRHHLITGQIDASILEEKNPDMRDPALDLYDAANGPRSPYSASFVDTYRQAQIARNRRISAWAKDKLSRFKLQGRDDDEYCFVVHGTMADPRWLDAALEPNDRVPNGSYLGSPQIVNNSAVALGRYSSLRSWLSQWSYDDAQVDSVEAGPRITVPSLVVTASADDACPPSHTDAIFAALGTKDKEAHVIKGANHYFSGPQGADHIAQLIALTGGWLSARGFSTQIAG